MKKEVFVLFVIFSLFISGCSGITGKGVINTERNEKIEECVKLCDDGTHVDGYFYNSCSKILEFGGEETFNDYLEKCK